MKKSIRKSSTVHTRSLAKGDRRKSHVTSRIRKKSISLNRKKSSIKSKSKPKEKRASANFYCMGCKDFSKGPISRYEEAKNGATFAKGECVKCGTRVSQIVKSDSVPVSKQR